MAPHFTDRLVERASEVLSTRTTTRRNFLVGGLATIGSAMVTFACSPVKKPGPPPVVRPGDCPPGSPCNDGFTEFCCTINNGANACPSGTFPSGWWRADGSSFCNGTRYYIDCNENCCGAQFGQFCETCSGCRCASDCNSRRIYCNYFRYGNCHQEIGLSGPIACRLASCVPPYELDGSCVPSSAVDNDTANQNAACLS